jgi:hypothetical protein
MNIREIIQSAGIVHAHIVDDAFDIAPGAELRPELVQGFLDSLLDEQFDELAKLLGIPEANEDKLNSFLSTLDGTKSLFNHREQFGEAAESLFEEFTSGLEPENNRVKPLIDFLEGLGIQCHTFGRDYEVDTSPEPQMLFVDLKLNERQIDIDEPIRVVKALKKQYPQAHLLVFLMSSAAIALQANQEVFRDKCELLSTQFEVLLKKMFTNPDELHLFLKHHISVYPRLCKLQDHISKWGVALDTAKQKLLQVMRCLDLADYFVLHHNTVAVEQVPLGTYVADLLLEYVAHEIESSQDVWAFAKDLDDWKLKELTRSRFNLQPIVGDIFSGNVLHAGTRITAELERGRGPSDGYFNLGDVFFSKAEITQGQPKNAMVVLSPACDLVRPSVLLERRGSILLCEGDVEILKPTSVLKEVDGLNPVVLRYPENGDNRFLVTWQKKRPHIWRLGDIKSFEDPDKTEWTLVGRLRPLYALQLQHAITADLSRIGVQRPPDQYVPHGVEVLVVKNNRWDLILKPFKTDPTAAAFSLSKSAAKMTFVLSDVVVRAALSRLRIWIGSNSEDPTSSLVQQVIDCSGVDSALMYHAHVTDSNQSRKPTTSNISDTIYPLHNLLPQGVTEEVSNSVIFALHGRETDNKYAGGKVLAEGERGVIVFRFLTITD